MTVSIDIDLDALGAKMEIANLRVMLESLGDDVDFDLDLDGELGDTLENLSDTMEEISESFSENMDETITRLENLEFDDIDMVDRGGGDSGGDTGSDSGDESDNRRLSKLFNALDRSTEEIRGRAGLDSDGSDSEDSRRTFSLLEQGWQIDNDRMERVRRMLSQGEAGSLQQKLDSLYGDDFDFTIDRELTNKMREKGESGLYGQSEFGTTSLDRYKDERDVDGIDTPDIDNDSSRRKGGLLSSLSGFNKKLNKSFKKLIPSMSTWINMLGMAVPALAAMAVQAAGVAAAMGSIAVAGGAVIGLGLIGHGDSMAESFRNAGKEVDELKQGLFNAFEPAADLFAPTQSEFFDFIPGEMDRVQQAMQGLLVFENDFFSLFRGLTKFVTEFFGVITKNSDAISYLTKRFSHLLGSSILDLFRGLLDTTKNNQEMLVQLGATLKVVAVAMYEVFLMVSKAIIWLSPLFILIAKGAKILNNDFAAGILGAIGLFYILGNLLPAIYLGFQALGFALQRSTIPAIGRLMAFTSGWISQKLIDIGVNYAWAASIGAVATAVLALAAVSGIGMLISGAGLLGMGSMKSEIPTGGDYSPSGGSSGGGTVINEGDTVNVEMGNADNATMEKFSDMRGGGGTRGPTGGSYT